MTGEFIPRISSQSEQILIFGKTQFFSSEIAECELNKFGFSVMWSVVIVGRWEYLCIIALSDSQILFSIKLKKHSVKLSVSTFKVTLYSQLVSIYLNNKGHEVNNWVLWKPSGSHSLRFEKNDR